MQVDVKKATIEMCREIAEVKKAVWETAYVGIYPNSKIDCFDIEKEAEKFATLVSAEDTHLYVAVADGKIVGYMAYGKNPRFPASDDNEMVLLSLLQNYQGSGIGRMLFEFGKARLKERCDHFILYCNKYNLKAQGFYKKMGCEVLSIDDDNPDHSIPQIKYICII